MVNEDDEVNDDCIEHADNLERSKYIYDRVHK